MKTKFIQSTRKADVILYTIAIFWFVTFIWSSLASIEEVTRGQGRVIASSKIQVIQNLEGGIIEDILVQTGDQVVTSQPLIKLEDIKFKSELLSIKQNKAALEANIVILSAESQGTEPQLDDTFKNNHPKLATREIKLHAARKTTHQESIEILEKKLQRLLVQSDAAIENFNLILEEKEIVEPLVRQGVEAEMELIRIKQRMNEAQSSILQVEAEIEANSAQLKAEKSNFIEQAREKLQEIEKEYNNIVESLPAYEDRLNRTVVRASMNAIVNRLMVNTVGGVIQPGSPLLELVPVNDELIVEVEISPKDIAYVIAGQRASIKLTAFDFSKFGALDGYVTKVSADSLTKEDGSIWYLCQVSVPVNMITTMGKSIQIQTGMVAQVDIISGEKTVLQYLIQPVTKVANEAFRER